jgi:hypothetical protein
LLFDPFLCKVDTWVHNGYKNEAEGVVQVYVLLSKLFVVVDPWVDVLDNGKTWLIDVYTSSLAWKPCMTPTYDTYHHLTKKFLLIFQPTKLVIVLHRLLVF